MTNNLNWYLLIIIISWLMSTILLSKLTESNLLQSIIIFIVIPALPFYGLYHAIKNKE
jgi:hypothetical protein